jgi:hypothetical protein
MVHTVRHEMVGRLKFAMSTLWRHTGAAEVQLHPFSSPALDEGEPSPSRPEPESIRAFQTVIWTLNRLPVRSLFTILTEVSQLPVAWQWITHWKESGSGLRHYPGTYDEIVSNTTTTSVRTVGVLDEIRTRNFPNTKGHRLSLSPPDNFIKFEYDLYNTFDRSYYIAPNNRIVNN